MRARLFVLAVALFVLALQWAGEPGRAVAPRPRRQESAVPEKPLPVAADEAPWPARARDPFHYELRESEGPRSNERPRFAAASPPIAAAPEPPPRVRLVGLVRRAGELQAALAVDGDVVLASVGDRVLDFTVASLEEEGTVRLRRGEGGDLTLALPEEP
jgi:hypothetical protein